MKYFLLLIFIAAAQGSQSKRLKRVVRMENNDPTNGTDLCFQFTWLANMDPKTFAPYLNKTCFDKYGTQKPMPLCVNPMVVTDNNREPNITALMINRYSLVTCTRQKGYACVKYTYRFNGEIQYITRYCTKVVVDDLPMDEGCVVSDRGATQTEVCACTSMMGKTPCNESTQLSLFTSVLMGIILLAINLIS